MFSMSTEVRLVLRKWRNTSKSSVPLSQTFALKTGRIATVRSFAALRKLKTCALECSMGSGVFLWGCSAIVAGSKAEKQFCCVNQRPFLGLWRPAINVGSCTVQIVTDTTFGPSTTMPSIIELLCTNELFKKIDIY